jgi:hypothetical protein
MPTKAEELRAQQQRRGITAKARKRAAATKSRAEKLATPHPAKRAARKATYAIELPSKAGKASRKSTRGSAKRAKADTNLNLREERTKTSPKARFGKARAGRARVRASRG